MSINILNLFHRRQQEAKGEIPSTYTYTLSITLKKRIIMAWAELSPPPLREMHAQDIAHYLRKAFGVFKLDDFSSSNTNNTFDEIQLFILRCKDDTLILSAIEVICRYFFQGRDDTFINDINNFFQYERIGYKFITEQDGFIVKIEDEIFYNETTAKTLGILSTKRYFDAQNYFIDSYKKLAASHYNDALVDIGRAMETVLKTRFTELNIPFDAQKDALNKLLDIAQRHIISQHHNFQYFKQIILDAGRARNTGGHGNAQGQAPTLDEVYVRFVINQAAANLLFLAEVPMQA